MRELMMNILVKLIVTLIIGTLTKIIFKKQKNHSNANKSGFELDIKIKFKK